MAVFLPWASMGRLGSAFFAGSRILHLGVKTTLCLNRPFAWRLILATEPTSAPSASTLLSAFSRSRPLKIVGILPAKPTSASGPPTVTTTSCVTPKLKTPGLSLPSARKPAEQETRLKHLGTIPKSKNAKRSFLLSLLLKWLPRGSLEALGGMVLGGILCAPSAVVTKAQAPSSSPQ